MKSSWFVSQLLRLRLVTAVCWLCSLVENFPTGIAMVNAQSSVGQMPSSKIELTQQSSPPVVPAPIKGGSVPLSLGLIVNDRNVLDGINIRGYEDGSKAIDFERWLVPFDEVIKAMGIRRKEASDGKTIELSSSSFRAIFDTSKLVDDPVLGRSISIANLQLIGGITAKFDLYKYAIAITLPTRSTTDFNATETPIDLEGLPTVSPSQISIAAIQQRSNLAGRNTDTAVTSGELKAVGSIGTGNWQIRIDQPTLTGLNNWNLNTANIFFPGKSTDLVVGSQPPFWSQSIGQNGSFWGATAISRNGFAPPTATNSEFNIADRLQSSRAGRSIIGQTTPGTVVQLVRSLNTEVIKEVLVDSSGTYRFENIVVGSVGDDTLGRDYRLLLYPRGQLTASPEIRDVQFTTILGQLPSGASAWVVSAGSNRATAGQFGTFDAIKGGALYRRGLNESLTVGVGSVYSDGVYGLGEVLFQPAGVPLEVAASASTGQQSNLLARLNYQPSANLTVTGNIDKLATRGDLNWRLSPGFAAIASYDSQTGTRVGGEFFARDRQNATAINASIDNRARVRWRASQTFDRLSFGYQANDVSSLGEISYRLPIDRDSLGEHEFTGAYQTNTQATTTTFGSLVWKYRPPGRTSRGNYLWQSELGYGTSLFGNGIIAGLDYRVSPGWQLRGRYRGVSESTRGNDFSVELVTTLDTQGGITGTDRSIEDVGTFGRVKVVPFLDLNGNGRRDPNEEGYFDPLLVEVNYKSLSRLRAQTEGLTTTLQLAPGSYRLDLNPAGYPINYRSKYVALRVDVMAGNTTEVPVPLVPAYALTGSVKNSAGEPIAGGRIEAISIANGEKYTSVTNDSGIYYLEGLEQGEYRLVVGGLVPKIEGCTLACSDRIQITPNPNPVRELNLSISPAPTPPPKSTTSFNNTYNLRSSMFINGPINY